MTLLVDSLDIDASPIKQQTGTRATRRWLRLVDAVCAAADGWSSATRHPLKATSPADR